MKFYKGGETTRGRTEKWAKRLRGERENGRNDPGAKRLGAKGKVGETTQGRTGKWAKRPGFIANINVYVTVHQHIPYGSRDRANATFSEFGLWEGLNRWQMTIGLDFISINVYSKCSLWFKSYGHFSQTDCGLTHNFTKWFGMDT